jgi:rRNA-processing protein FCF1
VVMIILDSNFVLAESQFQIDILRQLTLLLKGNVEPIIISPVIDELQSMTLKHESNRSRAAAKALDTIRSIQVEEVHRDPNESVDDVIVRISSQKKWAVATNDRKLRKRLDSLAVPTVYLRQRTHLEAKGIPT